MFDPCGWYPLFQEHRAQCVLTRCLPLIPQDWRFMVDPGSNILGPHAGSSSRLGQIYFRSFLLGVPMPQDQATTAPTLSRMWTLCLRVIWGHHVWTPTLTLFFASIYTVISALDDCEHARPSYFTAQIKRNLWKGKQDVPLCWRYALLFFSRSKNKGKQSLFPFSSFSLFLCT